MRVRLTATSANSAATKNALTATSTRTRKNRPATEPAPSCVVTSCITAKSAMSIESISYGSELTEPGNACKLHQRMEERSHRTGSSPAVSRSEPIAHAPSRLHRPDGSRLGNLFCRYLSLVASGKRRYAHCVAGLCGFTGLHRRLISVDRFLAPPRLTDVPVLSVGL